MVEILEPIEVEALTTVTIDNLAIWDVHPDYSGPEAGNYYRMNIAGSVLPEDATIKTGARDPEKDQWQETITIPDIPAGEWFVSLGEKDRYGSWTDLIHWTISASFSEVAIVPPEPIITDTYYTLPDTAGVLWEVNGDTVAAGTYPVAPTDSDVTVTILAVAGEGYIFDPPAEPVTHTWKAPTDAQPWPEAGEITAGGELVARWLKMTSDNDKADCSFYYDVALNYVWGYTKGKGFDDQMVPALPLQRVIVSGAARIAYNPESIHRWQISAESEYLTVFNGFNLAEQGILNRYRVRWA